MRLTDKIIQALELTPGASDKIWFDDNITGLGYRIRHPEKWNGNGRSDRLSRSWVFQYRTNGKTRRLTLGNADALKPAQARELASELHARVKLGFDPATEKRVRTERATHTFGSLVEKYLSRQRRQLRRGSLVSLSGNLKKHCAPLHTLPIDAIDQRIVATRLNDIEDNAGPVAANRTRSAMSAMFSWAMREGLARENPVANTNKREERARERVLTEAELSLIWRATDGDDYDTIIRTLILTGQRLSEISELQWHEIDFARNVISLPGERTKNGRPHEISISDTVRQFLESRPRRNSRDFVFGVRGKFGGLSRRKKKLDRAITVLNGGSPIPRWTIHDLRRTAATHMAEIGIQPHIIEAVLNHVSGHKGGIAGIYNRASYSMEKAQALALWDKHVAGLVS